MADQFPLGLDLEKLSSQPLTLEMCQNIVSALQKAIYQDNPINSFSPLRPAERKVNEHGHQMITEIPYGTRYMNSFLDITYPEASLPEGGQGQKHPTFFFAHGGGFFGGSKSMGDPMGAGGAPFYEKIVEAGYTLVNVDYVLTPEGHFPDPLVQFSEAIDFCLDHAEEYGLDMSRVIIGGSSAGAVLTTQYGCLLANPSYREALGIRPRLDPGAVKCLVVDDAPFRPERFNWALKVMMANYLGTVDFSSQGQSLNAYEYFHPAMAPCFFTAGPKDGFPEDMKACHERLQELGAQSELFLPEGDLPHGYLNLYTQEPEAAACVQRIIAFMDRHTKKAQS